MSDKEQCAMNAWLAEHAMDWKRVKTPTAIVAGTFFWNKGDVLIHYQRNELKAFCPTTDPAAAMQVLEKILQTMGSMPVITTAGKKFVWANPKKHEPYHDADTLYLAICLFAKQLFSK